MSESSEEKVYTFAVLELDLGAHREALLQRKSDFLILGKLNSRLEFTHDQSLKLTLSHSGLQNIVEMNNKMGNIPKRVIQENNDVEDTIEEVPGIRSLILTNIMTGHVPYSFFYVIQYGKVKRCLMYFYFEQRLNSMFNEIVKKMIRKGKDANLKDNYLRIVGNKQIKIAELQEEISKLKIKIEIIREFYPNIPIPSSGGSKKSKKKSKKKKNTQRKSKAKKTRRTNKKFRRSMNKK